MATIELTRGQQTIVDDDDWKWLSEFCWHARVSHGGRKFYAYRGLWDPQAKRMRPIPMHREIIGATPELHVDHISGDTLDNRRSNLRLCTRSQNLANSETRINKSSRFKGVSWHKRDKSWYAYINQEGSRINIGSFREEIAAAVAYDAKAIELFGAFARPNFPPHQRAA